MFFTYTQNNPGGRFVNNDRLCEFVIIEAGNARGADVIAEDLGIYFNGCSTGADCHCCGDRWDSAVDWDDLGTKEPILYGLDPASYRTIFGPEGIVYCRVYYANGLVAEHIKKPQEFRSLPDGVDRLSEL